MAQGKKHSEETRAAVMAALLANQVQADIARKYHVTPSYITRMKAQLGTEQLEQLRVEKLNEFARLLSESLKSIIEFMAFLPKFVRTQEGLAWIKEHSPAEAATLYGVISDKGFRLLEAAGAAEEANAELLEEPANAPRAIPETFQ